MRGYHGTTRTVPGAQHLTSIVARGFNGAAGAYDQSLKIDGVERITTPADGVWLGVLDRATHALSSHPNDNRSYDLGTDLATLIVQLGTLGEDKLVVIVSRGDASAAMNTAVLGTTLAGELIALGASVAVRTLGPSEAFVLVGYRGIGEGNAAFVFSSTGLADAMVLVADGTVLGPRTASPLGREITSDEIVDGTLVAADLADGSVTSAAITDGAVGTADLADSCITNGKIVDGTITSADIADGAIVDADISSSAAIASSKISGLGSLATLSAVGGGTGGTITDGTITNADISASAAIATSKISGLGSLATLSAVSGGTLGTITDGTITAADLAAGSVTNAKLGLTATVYSASAGTNTATIPAKLCALIRVEVNATGQANCQIVYNAGQWTLYTGGAASTCAMVCFQ